MKTQVPFVFSFAVMVIGLGVALYSFKQINLARGSHNWPGVPAKIISSEVKATQREAEKKRVYTTLSADIAFQYTVNGKEFTSNLTMIDQPPKTFSTDAQTLVQKYPAGSTVLAHYNPQNPSQALLETGVSRSTYVAFVFGLVWRHSASVYSASACFRRHAWSTLASSTKSGGRISLSAQELPIDGIPFEESLWIQSPCVDISCSHWALIQFKRAAKKCPKAVLLSNRLGSLSSFCLACVLLMSIRARAILTNLLWSAPLIASAAQEDTLWHVIAPNGAEVDAERGIYKGENGITVKYSGTTLTADRAQVNEKSGTGCGGRSRRPST